MIQIQVNLFPSSAHTWWLPLLFTALLFLVVSISSARYLRGQAWKKGRFKNSNWFATWADKHWGILMISGAVLLIVFWCVVLAWLFGLQNIVSGIVFGSTLSFFLLFQLPKLLSPHIQIVPIEAEYIKLYTINEPANIERNILNREDGKKIKVKCSVIPLAKLNQWYQCFLHIANTGINSYKNFSIHLILDQPIRINPTWLGKAKHGNVVYQKTEEICDTIVYSGYSLGPNQDLIIEFWVTVERVDSVIRLEASSSNRWGDTVKYLSWQLKE